MSKYFLLVIAASVCLALTTFPSFAKTDDPQDRVCLYKHDNFHGHEQCFRPGAEISDLKDSDVSSIRVYGHARAVLFENRDFRGHEMEVTGSTNWHDHVGSLRVTNDYGYKNEKSYNQEYLRYKPYPLVDPVSNGVCVYEKPNYDGRYQCWASGTAISNLVLSEWDGKISSVRVFGHGRLVGFKRNVRRLG
jgi:hypothetical protein